MKALVAVLGLLVGCSYTAPIDFETDAAPAGDDDPTPTPDGPNEVAPCATPDPTGLVLCLEMEDDVADGKLLDSSPGHHDATTESLAPAMRPVTFTTVPAMSPAADIGPSSVIRVAEDPAFDRDSAYTVALWLRPDSLPPQGSVYGLLDHEQQFAMLIGRSAGGSLQNRCVHTGVARFEWTEQLPENAWSFLACTWDGATMCAWRWSADESTERFCHQPTILPNASGAEGLAIGHLSEQGAPHSRFDGALDSVQIYDRGMTEPQLCALIGKAPGCMPCNSGC